jgi:hypothetical protein
MDPKIRQLLNQLPPKPFRSKLEAHLELIRELRQRRLTWGEVAQFLANNLNLTVAPSTIYAFMHARVRRHRLSVAANSGTSLASLPAPTSQTASRPVTRIALTRPFHFDPSKGLTLTDEDLNLKPKKD